MGIEKEVKVIQELSYVLVRKCYDIFGVRLVKWCDEGDCNRREVWRFSIVCLDTLIFLADESDMDLFRGYIGKGRISLYIESVFLSNLMKNHLEQWVKTTKKK